MAPPFSFSWDTSTVCCWAKSNFAYFYSFFYLKKWISMESLVLSWVWLCVKKMRLQTKMPGDVWKATMHSLRSHVKMETGSSGVTSKIIIMIQKKNRQWGFRFRDWTSQHMSVCQKRDKLDRKWTTESTWGRRGPSQWRDCQQDGSDS